MEWIKAWGEEKETLLVQMADYLSALAALTTLEFPLFTRAHLDAHTLFTPLASGHIFPFSWFFSLQGLSGPDVHACSYDRRLVSSSLFSYFWWDQREQEQRGKWEELCQVFSHECLLYCREGNWEKKHREREREGGGLCHLTQGLFPLEGGRDERREKKSGWTIGEQQKQWGVC